MKYEIIKINIKFFTKFAQNKFNKRVIWPKLFKIAAWQ